MFSKFLNDLVKYYTVFLPYYLDFSFLNICSKELGLKISSMTCIICVTEFCSNLPIFIFTQYTISITYLHGSGSIFNVLNNTQQEVFLPTLLINLVTFFCNLQIFFTFPITTPDQYAIP